MNYRLIVREPYTPTPAEIAAEAARIRKGWSAATEAQRRAPMPPAKVPIYHIRHTNTMRVFFEPEGGA